MRTSTPTALRDVRFFLQRDLELGGVIFELLEVEDSEETCDDA